MLIRQTSHHTSGMVMRHITHRFFPAQNTAFVNSVADMQHGQDVSQWPARRLTMLRRIDKNQCLLCRWHRVEKIIYIGIDPMKMLGRSHVNKASYHERFAIQCVPQRLELCRAHRVRSIAPWVLDHPARRLEQERRESEPVIVLV